MNSGELIAKYGKQQIAKEPTKILDLDLGSSSNDYIYYAQNSFKRFMGYEEPDYLMVAGLYASIESSSKSSIYNHFLVKGIDYIAKMLKWYTDDGELDTRRAKNAFNTACKKEAPNGLFYMYTVSNKNKCLSDKGGSRIYMSGRRYFLLQKELADNNATYDSVIERVKWVTFERNADDRSDMDLVKRVIRNIADIHRFVGYDEGAVVWVSKQLLKRLSAEQILYYCNQITSELYLTEAKINNGCPKLFTIFDLCHKYDKIQRFMSDTSRHLTRTNLNSQKSRENLEKKAKKYDYNLPF